jgi:hypothetical protein
MAVIEKERSASFDNGPLKENGQYTDYAVLPKEERDKGFVRLLRDSYIHVGIAEPKNELRDLTKEELERYEKFKYVKFEAYPVSESPTTGRFWTQADLDKIGKGCGVETIMGHALAETYARDPSYYGATFCCGCGKHLPVSEFVWKDTTERVGS